MRSNLVMMRKNVVKVPRKNSAQSAIGGRAKKLVDEEIVAEEPPEEEVKIETTSTNVLALPNIGANTTKNKQKAKP